MRQDLAEQNLLEGQVRIPSGCAVAAIIDRAGTRMPGDDIVRCMVPMHDRSSGLGGGFAGYGIYPEHADCFAFHLFFDSRDARRATESYLKDSFEVVDDEYIPTRTMAEITDEPFIRRYFLRPPASALARLQIDEDEYVMRAVMHVNTHIPGAYVFSSGKNMGVFKAVGYPEDVGRYYRLEDYGAYLWTAHGRYPTNTPGWWGGAHPFALGQYSVVHNGEISSYDANRRFIEMFGYKCTLQTDTEVITYIADYLLRRTGLTLEETAHVMAAPFWDTIEHLPDATPEQHRAKAELVYLRKLFPSLLVTGPFSIILGFTGGCMALNDRLKLRSMVAAEEGSRTYIASEEAAIRAVAPNAEHVFSPAGGVPFVVRVEEGRY